jgi:hypothetical protein
MSVNIYDRNGIELFLGDWISHPKSTDAIPIVAMQRGSAPRITADFGNGLWRDVDSSDIALVRRK